MQNQCTILCIFIFLFLAICILPFTSSHPPISLSFSFLSFSLSIIHCIYKGVAPMELGNVITLPCYKDTAPLGLGNGINYGKHIYTILRSISFFLLSIYAFVSMFLMFFIINYPLSIINCTLPPLSIVLPMSMSMPIWLDIFVYA